MPARRVSIETFGCQMNELDSELVVGRLRALGYSMVSREQDADVVLFNTCSVRERAEQKVWSRLGLLAKRKESEPRLVVGVLGCLAERDGEALMKRMPVVDVLCGPGELDKLPIMLDNAVRTRESLASELTGNPDASSDLSLVSAHQIALQGNSSRRSSTLAAAEDTLELLDLSRAISPTDNQAKSRTAYVRITRGCNKFCTYCVVPFTRGAEVHRPPDHIVDECRRLADAGVIEITLLGQTVNHYRFEHGAAVTLGGITQPQKGRSYSGGHSRDPFSGRGVTTFADLLRRIHEEVPSILRLRFVTSYPRDFGDDVLEVMRDHPRICRYLHVPAQSGSDRILKLMNRGYTVGEYLEFLDRARAYLHQPDIGRPLMLSGDFIVGFPTESDEDFASTIRLIEQARYKNSFIFKYSPRPGTAAFDRLDDDVPETVKRARNNELLAIQERISHEISQEQVGRTVDAFVEGLSAKERKRAPVSSASQGDGLVRLTIGGKQSFSHPSDTDDDFGCGSRPAILEVDRVPGAIQLSARTDGDLIAFFDLPGGEAPDDWIGRIVRLRVVAARPLGLMAEVCREAPGK